MADSVETDFLKQVRAKSKDAVKWFRNLVKETQRALITGPRGRKELKARNIDVQGRLGGRDIGSMFFFQYNAKHDKEYPILPYWDRFPLIFPFEPATGGFYGINLHYLNEEHRLNLMRALIKVSGVKGNLDEDYRLKLSWKLISKFKPAKKCVKRYINTRSKGGFYKIGGNDWPYAVGLPIQSWKVNDKDIHKRFLKDWEG